MSINPILDELHATRAKLLAEAGGDLHRYVTEAKERALASGRTIAEPTQRTSKALTSRGTRRSSRPVFKKPD